MKVIKGDNLQVVPIKLSEEEYDQLEKLSGINYTDEQICMYLDIDLTEFRRQLAKPESLIHYHYNRGKLIVQFEIDEKLSDNARSGNITAVDIFSKRQESLYINNLKRKYFNNGY